MTPEEKEICAEWWAQRFEIAEKRDMFKTLLIDKLDDNMILSVDYDPDDVLLEVVRESGVKCSGSFFSAKGILPSKTQMKIRWHRNNNITVKEGYGMWYEVLV